MVRKCKNRWKKNDTYRKVVIRFSDFGKVFIWLCDKSSINNEGKASNAGTASILLLLKLNDCRFTSLVMSGGIVVIL